MTTDDDPFTAWLRGFDAAADHLLAVGVDRTVVLELNRVLQVINLLRAAALVTIRRDALDQALSDAPLVEAA
jgi:hypothetical protein